MKFDLEDKRVTGVCYALSGLCLVLSFFGGLSAVFFLFAAVFIAPFTRIMIRKFNLNLKASLPWLLAVIFFVFGILSIKPAAKEPVNEAADRNDGLVQTAGNDRGGLLQEVNDIFEDIINSVVRNIPEEIECSPDMEIGEGLAKEAECGTEDASSDPLLFDYALIPEYSGYSHVEVNGNEPYFSPDERTCVEAFEYYSPLDSMGRCTEAYANVCTQLQPTEPRGEIGDVRPTGWHTVKYPDLIEDGMFLYNRCHLIGFQLTGENANERNLITGTRYLNVVGMLPYENSIDSYVEQTGNHVLYRVTPIFCGDELVARGVLMEGYSVEDCGAGICFCVFCYNVQPGIQIDYQTGDSWEEPSVVSYDNVIFGAE